MSKKNKKPYVNNNYGKCMPDIYHLYCNIKKTVKDKEEALKILNEAIKPKDEDPWLSYNMRNFVTNLLREELNGRVIHMYVPGILTELFKIPGFENMVDAAKYYMKECGTDLITRKVNYEDGMFEALPLEKNKVEQFFIHPEGIEDGLICRIKYEVKTDKISVTYFNGYDYAELREDTIDELNLSTRDGKVDKCIWTFVMNLLSFLVLFGTDFKPGLPGGVKVEWPSSSGRVTLLVPKELQEELNKAAKAAS